MKSLILAFSIAVMILAETTNLADAREAGTPLTSAQSQDIQPQSGVSANVTTQDVRLAKSSMERTRNRGAENLVVALAAVIDLRYGATGFESLGIENDVVTISGAIQGESKVESLRKLAQLRSELDKYHEGIQVLGQEHTRGGGLGFTLQLQSAADFINCLTSQETKKESTPAQQKSAGQFWRKAEEQKQAAEKLFSRNDYGGAKEAYEQAEELFWSATSFGDAYSIEHIVELQDSLTALRSELETLQIADLPDRIVFKGGREMKCEIIAETPDSIRIRMKTGTAVIPRTQIDSVDNVSQGGKQQRQRLISEIQKIEEQQKELRPFLEDLYEGLQALLPDDTGNAAQDGKRPSASIKAELPV